MPIYSTFRRRKLSLVALALGSALILSACTPTIQNRGSFIDADRLQKIEIGKSTATDVQQILGTPSASANYGDLTWYYIGQEVESLAFYTPEVNKQEVLVVRFNKDATVASVEKKGIDAGRTINPVTDTTPTADRGMTIFQQLLGNVGRFSGKEGQRTSK